MFAGLCKSVSHPFIQDPKRKKSSKPPSASKSFTLLELPLLLPERNDGPRPCDVAIIPLQTMRGHRLTPNLEKHPTDSNIGSDKQN